MFRHPHGRGPRLAPNRPVPGRRTARSRRTAAARARRLAAGAAAVRTRLGHVVVTSFPAWMNTASHGHTLSGAGASSAVGRKLSELMADADQPGDLGIQLADPLADQCLGVPAGAGTPVAHREQVGDLTKPEPKLLSAADETAAARRWPGRTGGSLRGCAGVAGAARRARSSGACRAGCRPAWRAWRH